MQQNASSTSPSGSYPGGAYLPPFKYLCEAAEVFAKLPEDEALELRNGRTLCHNSTETLYLPATPTTPVSYNDSPVMTRTTSRRGSDAQTQTYAPIVAQPSPAEVGAILAQQCDTHFTLVQEMLNANFKEITKTVHEIATLEKRRSIAPRTFKGVDVFQLQCLRSRVRFLLMQTAGARDMV